MRRLLMLACLLVLVGLALASSDEPQPEQNCVITNCNCKKWNDCSTCTGKSCECRCFDSAHVPATIPTDPLHSSVASKISIPTTLASKSALCKVHQGSAKLSPGTGERLFIGAYYPGSSSVSAKVFVENPTLDDVFYVHAFTTPCTPTTDGCIVLPGSSCEFPPGYKCVYRQPKNMVTSLFNITTCSDFNAAAVDIFCLETPGFFNRHCELSYTMLFCEEAPLPQSTKQCNL